MMLKQDRQKKNNRVVSTFKVLERPSRDTEISISRTLKSTREVGEAAQVWLVMP